jgi:hypothetical protein
MKIRNEKLCERNTYLEFQTTNVTKMFFLIDETRSGGIRARALFILLAKSIRRKPCHFIDQVEKKI